MSCVGKNPAMTVERMRRLEEMGVDTSDASMVYVVCPVAGELTGPQANTGQYEPGDCYAYTVEDVLKKLSTMKDHTFMLSEYVIAILGRNADEEKEFKSGEIIGGEFVYADMDEWHSFKTMVYNAFVYAWENGYINNENKEKGWLKRGMP